MPLLTIASDALLRLAHARGCAVLWTGQGFVLKRMPT